MQNRIEKLKQLGSAKELDAILLFNKIPESIESPNFFYFTDIGIQGIFYYDFSKPVLMTSIMEKPRVRSGIKNIQVIQKTEEFLKTINGKIGIDMQHTSAAITDKISKKTKTIFFDISEELESIRAIKSQQEIETIRKAVNISKTVYKKVCSEDIFGFTECELRGFIDYQVNRMGAEPAFPTIVAAGGNIAVPHHRPTQKKNTTPLLIDFGVRYKGYCSDISRTFHSRYENRIMSILADLEKQMKPGIKVSQLDAFARKKLGPNAKSFITSLGHGIGIAVHEKPHISSSSKDVLKPGMVVAIEPAIYVSNGIRIENDYLITKHGCENLTDF